MATFFLSISQKTWFTLFVVFLAVFSIFSYALTAPNLVLSSWDPYWQFQTWMWQTFFNNRQLLAGSFTVLGLGLCITYLGVAGKAWHSQQSLPLWQLLLVWLLALLGVNALSYDLFNYIFNAKMLVVYQANPHIQVALDFATDPWVRFMHNTHTPAPYGYGWTYLSLIPYLVGMGKFLLTWLSFKFFSLLSLFLTFITLKWLAQGNTKAWLASQLLLLHPLVVIEVLSSGHNDFWMLWPALLSLGLLTKRMRVPLLWVVVTSAGLLLLSISIKLATVVLAPVWLLLLVSKGLPDLRLVKDLKPWWPLMASVLLFMPLVSLRSQQFHPWYLLWPLVWLPLVVNIDQNNSLKKFLQPLQNWWLISIGFFSITSFFRYIPYLLSGEYSTAILQQQKVITWSALVFSGAVWLVFFIKSNKVKK